MKITINIDVNTLEGKQIFEYLKGFPEVVTFENELLNESQEEYHDKAINTTISSKGYELGEVEAMKKEKEERKLSKVGEWLRSNEKPIITSYDMRAVLK